LKEDQKAQPIDVSRYEEKPKRRYRYTDYFDVADFEVVNCYWRRLLIKRRETLEDI
jgi:hypothetical protein